MTEETQAPEPEPTIEPGEGFSEEGNLVTRDLLYDEHTNKQFITVQTAGGNTFYIVIDYDKPVDEEGELILMDKVSRGAGRRVKQTAARFFCWERRCGYRYNLHPALQGSGGKNCYSDNGGSVCLRAQSEKAGGHVCLPLRSGIGPR